MFHILVLFFLVLSCNSVDAKQLTPSINLNSYIKIENDSIKVSGSIIINEWENAKGRYCLYLPFNNPYFPWRKNSIRYLESSEVKEKFTYTNERTIEIKNKIAFPIHGRKDIVEIPKSSRFQEIYFKSNQPISKSHSRKDFLLQGFYPIPLRDCPSRISPKPNIYSTLRTNSTLQNETDYQVITNHEPNKTHSYPLAIVIYKDNSLKKIISPNKDILIFSPEKKAIDSLETASHAIEYFQSKLGDLPYKPLKIFFTQDTPSLAMPGLILMRPSRQGILKALQENYLNWTHWAISFLVNAQWFGVRYQEVDPIDRWFIDGFNDFYTASFLSKYTQRTNLFNSYNYDFSAFQLSFMSVQNISASTLAITSDSSTMTNNRGESIIPYHKQHPLIFIRHSLALKHLKNILGEDEFVIFQKNLFKHFDQSQPSPEEFSNALTKFASTRSKNLQAQLSKWNKAWWESNLWPNFKLLKFNQMPSADSQSLVNISISAQKPFDFTVPIVITNNKDQKYSILTKNKIESNASEVIYSEELVVPGKVKEIEIDPDKNIFDINRFNNRLSKPSIYFFPGNAKTLYDSDFTAIWLPYLFRRPGEPFSLGLQMAILKFLKSGLLLDSAFAPEESLGSFTLKQYNYIPQSSLTFGFLVNQNYDNQRLAQVTLEKNLSIFDEISVTYGLAVRHKQTTGQNSSAHQSMAIPIQFKSKGKQKKCAISGKFESESLPEATSRDYQYYRQLSSQKIHCRLLSHIEIDSYFFQGFITGSDSLPKQTLFKANNLKEASLRLDSKNLTPSRRIASYNFELLGPAYLAVPKSLFIVNKGLKYRVFFDQGRAYDPENTFRSAGFGFTLPFGGDVVGAGTLTFTKLSLLAIMYSEAGGKTSNKPSIVFDLSGEI